MTIKRRSLLLLASAAFISSRAYGQNQCQPPLVTAVYPSIGSGNSLVAIVGSGFTGATAVQVGSGAAVQSYTVVSDTQINAYMAFHSNGTRPVLVTTSQGTSTGSVTFTHGPAEVASITANPDLPNPYVFNNGTAVTTKAQWALKQFELREAYAAYWLGHIPPPSPVSLTGTVNDATVGGTQMRNVQVNLQTGPAGAIKFGLNMYIPLNAGAGPFPVVLGSNWAWSPLAATPSSSFSASLGTASLNTLCNRGYIIAEMSLDQFSLDDGDTSPPEGIFTLNTASDAQLANPGPGSSGNGAGSPGVNPISNQYYQAYPIDRTGGPTVTYPSFITAGLNTPPTGAGDVTGVDTGVQGAWGWGFMRCVDYLVALGSGTGGVTVPVDATKITVTSISHDGGPPLYAAAFDTRIAAALIAQGLGIYSGSRLCEYENAGPGGTGIGGSTFPTVNSPVNGSGENQVANPPRSVCRYIGSAVAPTGTSLTVFQNYESIPSDNHFLMAMVAPRGFMAVANYIGAGGIDSPRACAQKFLTGQTAWTALGANPAICQCWCSDNNSISGVTNGHILTTAQYTQMLNYLDYYFKSTALPADVTSPTGSKSIWCTTRNDFNTKSGVSGSPINGSTLTSNTACGFTWTPPSTLT